MNFSIVIPMYNKRKTIRRAIHSVCGQSHHSTHQIQLIIVDDGSTDESLTLVNKVVNEIKKENSDSEIIVYSQSNQGVSAARNKGVELAEYDLVCFLDADDTYEPNFIEEISALALTYPDASVFCTSYRFLNISRGTKRKANLSGMLANKDRQILKSYFYSAAKGDLPITSSSVCIRKQALLDIGGFPIAENMGEDQTVWSKLAIAYKIAISKKVCANYYEATNGSLMQTIAPSAEMVFSRDLQKQLDAGSIAHNEINPVQLYISGHLLDLVRRNIKLNNLGIAEKILSDHRARKQLCRWLFWQLNVKLAWIKTAFIKHGHISNET